MEQPPELRAALNAHRSAFVGIGVASAIINALYLTGSFFMLEVYDRVLPSRSLPTLTGLLLIAGLLYFFQGALDVVRGRLLVRVGAGLDELLNERLYRIILELPLKTRVSADGMQPLRDLDQVRAFLSGGGPMALFDLPWMVVYLGICFAFHVWIGLTALAGALVLIALTILTEVLTRKPSREASLLGSRRIAIGDSNRRNAEVIRAMGMASRVTAGWRNVNDRYITTQRRAADVASGLGAISKVFRMMLQSAVLAVGAYLVIQQQTTSGIIIASSILTARALAPVELAIANWRGFLGARQSWARLRELLRNLPAAVQSIELAAPRSGITIENISVAPPGAPAVLVHDIGFSLQAGQGLGIVGPSGSGKSSLVRAIVGVWPIVRGKVRIDGAALEQWNVEQLGQHIGYLPQDVELFAGSVAQNISRFDSDLQEDAIVEAAKSANVHELILRLPNGYETEIGEGGASLSAGQRQRVALARALYKRPFLIILDEPNSNLDQDGEAALGQAIRGVRARGGIVILVAHRPSILTSVDMLLVMAENGSMRAFGPREEILAKLTRPMPMPTPLTILGQKG